MLLNRFYHLLDYFLIVPVSNGRNDLADVDNRAMRGNCRSFRAIYEPMDNQVVVIF